METTQDGLFSAEPYQRTVRKPMVEIPPATGVRWKRTALRRDCAGCWEQQHAEYKAGSPLSITRKPAAVELKLWSDEGELTHHEFYCNRHGEALGWDSSRSKGAKSRRIEIDKEAIARAKLAGDLTGLIRQAARGAMTSAWRRELREAIGRAGGTGLDMPDWRVAADGKLTGTVSYGAWRVVKDWADRFGADITTEHFPGENRLSVICKLADSIPVEIIGYAEHRKAA